MRKDVELFDLTNPQLSIWLTEQLYRDTNIHNIGGSVIIDDIVNFEYLERALNIYVQRNEAIRTRLTIDNGTPKQYINEFLSFNVESIAVENEDSLKELSHNIYSETFNLIDSDLFRFEFVKFDSGRGGFFVCFHHIICDAWTMSLFVTEVMDIYSKLLNGEEINTDLNPSYIEYIDSENKYMSSETYLKDQSFWNNIFSYEPEVSSLKILKNIDSVSLSAERKEFYLESNFSNRIQNFCKENSFSIFSFLTAVFSIYMSKINNFNNPTIGTYILNRGNFKQKNTAGMFISTLPLNINMDFESNFTDFVKTIAINQMSLFRHQKYPYHKLLEDVRKKYHNSPNLYDVVLSYQNARNSKNSSSVPFHTNWKFTNNCVDGIDIHIYDLDDTGNINIFYDYQLCKFNGDEIISIHNRIIHIIEQILQDSSILLRDIDIVTEDEKQTLIYEFNNTKTDYLSDKTIHELFELQVQKTPDKTAIVFEDAELSYEELNKRANQLARYLRDKCNIEKNSFVGIMLNRSLEMVIGILAIIKAGATYVPLDPEYPIDRITYMLENCKAKTILVHSPTKNNLKGFDTISIDLNQDLYVNSDSTNLLNLNSPDDLIYTIYTSGSTGKPKGVMLTHKNINNYICGLRKVIDFSSDKTIVSVTTICFDIFVTEIWGGLISGLKIVLANESEQNIPMDLNKLCLKHNVNMIQTTPSRFSIILKDELGSKFLNNITDLMVGGEPLPQTLLTALDAFKNMKLYNMYGPTETAVWSTIKESPNPNDITIGTPIANTQVYILDKYKKLLPENVPGELYIGGDGVSKGYYNREDLTNKVFVQSPFSDDIIYNTNDLAYVKEDGEFVHLGRTDFQAKIHGFRIEITEIEDVILSYPGIKNVVVLVIDQNLIAYYVSDIEINTESLVPHILKTLPHYMVPKIIKKIDSIPLTPNGKVNRKDPIFQNISFEQTSSIEITEAKTKYEKLLLPLICEHLDISIGTTQNIFEYGADSLSIIRILSDLYKYDLNLSVQDFYNNPTVKLLAQKIENDIREKKENSLYLTGPISVVSEKVDGFLPPRDKNHIVLTGANGFLGMHILSDIIENTDYSIYCLIRDKEDANAVSRLTTIINYYFGNKYEHFIDNRIKIISSEITEKNLGLSKEQYLELGNNTLTVIHSAADVRHFGNYALSKKVNVNATKNLIDFCIDFNILFNHISTMTVSGYGLVNVNTDKVFDENSFYISQDYNDNIYVKTKLLAEDEIYRSLERGLIANIYRVGNLTNSFSTCKFQINSKENAFLNRLRSIKHIGVLPDELRTFSLEFTPVDCCADAIMKIINSFKIDRNINVYHLYNNKSIPMSNLLRCLNELNINIGTIDKKQFIETIIKNSNDISQLSGFINNVDIDLAFESNDQIFSNQATLKTLNSLCFEWPEITDNYLKNIIINL